MNEKIIKIFIVVCFAIVMIGCGKDNEVNDKVEKIDTMKIAEENVISEAEESKDFVFSRDLYRTIPEGYKEVEWEAYEGGGLPGLYSLETPAALIEEYAMVENNITGMRGLVDYEGNFIIEPKYNEICYCWYENEMPYFEVEYESDTYIVDINGQKQDFELPYHTRGKYITNYWIALTADNGYYTKNIGGGNIESYIYNPENEIVGGPYSELVRLEDNVFYHHEYTKAMEERGYLEERSDDSIGFFDSIENCGYMLDGSLLCIGNDTLQTIIRNKKTAIFSGFGEEISIINYETNTKTVLEGNYRIAYEDAIIYESNGTYKYVDWNNNSILEERYYGYIEVCENYVFLKNDKGEWICLKENGQRSIDYGNFYGEGEQPDFYNELPIVGYWEYEGVPCVVVENIEEGLQIGYSLI